LNVASEHEHIDLYAIEELPCGMRELGESIEMSVADMQDAAAVEFGRQLRELDLELKHTEF
jgi:hypothetical protein